MLPNRFCPASRLSAWYIGAGNVGAAVTKLGAPWVMNWWGSWQGVAEVWAIAPVVVGINFWCFTSDEI